jgi:MtrB/PioB family decaheme-associated outer membrane protein
MRTRTCILIGALLLVSAATASAQQQPLNSLERMPGTAVAVSVPSLPDSAPAGQTAKTETAAPAATPSADTTTVPTPAAPKLGRFDVGYRGNNVKGDAARFNRYRDLTDGAYLDRFRFDKETETWLFHADANNVGYDDQRFGGEFQSIGKLKASFQWDQIPLFISDSTASLYTNLGNGKLVVDDAVQAALQATGTNTALRDQVLNTAIAGAKPFDMKSRRDTGTFGMVYSFDRNTDLKVNVRTYDRSGYNLMSFGFGTSPGLLPALEMGVPTDDRSTTFKSQLEFANTRGLLSVGYDGSWYNNHLPTVQFENPFRATDISGGASNGQVPMWATNSSFAVNVNGSYKLPARTRANAAISVGQWNQNADLVPPTVNTALVAPPLERPSAEAKADITSMLYTVTSRPGERLWLNAKYRYYDYHNKTPLFEATPLIGDWSLGTGVVENEPASMKRQTLDLDASFELGRYLGVGGGYTREIGDRSFRIFEKTTDDIYRVTIDSTGNQYVAVRAKYEHSQRTGSGFDQALLDEVGEQPTTRHYDIADRDRDRFTTTVTFTPVPNFDVNAAVSTGKDDYKNTGFGLRDNDNKAWNVGFDSTLAKTINLGGTYGYEKYTANQYSRSANPPTPTDSTFYDATRDWTLDQADKVKTYGLYMDFNRTLPKTDIRLNYDLSDGKATYVYGLMPDQKLFTTTPLAQVAPLKNVLTDVRSDVQYYVRPNLALGFTYLFEKYAVDDFSLTDTTINKLNATNATTGAFANMIYSGYLYRDYTAHTGWLRLTYLW